MQDRINPLVSDRQSVVNPRKRAFQGFLSLNFFQGHRLRISCIKLPRFFSLSLSFSSSSSCLLALLFFLSLSILITGVLSLPSYAQRDPSKWASKQGINELSFRIWSAGVLARSLLSVSSHDFMTCPLKIFHRASPFFPTVRETDVRRNNAWRSNKRPLKAPHRDESLLSFLRRLFLTWDWRGDPW